MRITGTGTGLPLVAVEGTAGPVKHWFSTFLPLHTVCVLTICWALIIFWLAARGISHLLVTSDPSSRRGRWRRLEQSPGGPALPADPQSCCSCSRWTASHLPRGGYWMWAQAIIYTQTQMFLVVGSPVILNGCLNLSQTTVTLHTTFTDLCPNCPLKDAGGRAVKRRGRTRITKTPMLVAVVPSRKARMRRKRKMRQMRHLLLSRERMSQMWR